MPLLKSVQRCLPKGAIDAYRDGLKRGNLVRGLVSQGVAVVEA